MSKNSTYQLQLERAERGPVIAEAETITLHTDRGAIDCRLHRADGDAGIIWVGGAGGGLGGPAGGLYPRLAAQLLPDKITSLRLHYRRPNDLVGCVLDTLLAAEWLAAEGVAQLALVGHSFGGAVVITAGASTPLVVAVAALSSQTAGTELVGQLSPRPLLLLHGTADDILPDRCSRELYRRAGEPKRLELYPGCGHGLDECREQLDRDLTGWLRQVLAPVAGTVDPER